MGWGLLLLQPDLAFSECYRAHMQMRSDSSLYEAVLLLGLDMPGSCCIRRGYCGEISLPLLEALERLFPPPCSGFVVILMSSIPLCSFLVHLKIEHNLSSWAPERDHYSKRIGEQY